MSEIKFKVNNNENLDNKEVNQESDAKTWLGIGVGIGLLALSVVCPTIAAEFIGYTQATGAILKVASKIQRDERLEDIADVMTTGSSIGNGANFAARKFSANHIKSCNNC